MTSPQLNFKASAYEEEVEREVKSKRDNYTWWQWNLSGAAAWKNYKKEITAWLKKNL